MTSQAANSINEVYTIDELRDVLSESEIREIAKARTDLYETITIGNSYQHSKDRQLNFDITQISSGGVSEVVNPFGGVVEAIEPSDKQYIYSLQFISSNTFVERDLYLLGLRQSEFDSYTDSSAYVNSRIPLFDKWNTGLRLNVSKRDSKSYGKRITVSPVVKLTYRLSRAWSFDADVGMDFVDNAGQPDEERKRLRLSYSYTF